MLARRQYTSRANATNPEPTASKSQSTRETFGFVTALSIARRCLSHRKTWSTDMHASAVRKAVTTQPRG